jgi:GT2 family glycosyltransferase
MPATQPTLVSILIPAYNAERWIGQTIASALSQTWPNKEIIIVDDGSSDSTVAVAKTYQTRLLKIVTQSNLGAAAARNKALSFAQGDYIQWLDADDLLAPDKISQQLAATDSRGDSRVLLTSPFGTFFYCHQRAKYQPTSLWRTLTPLEWMAAKFIDNAWMNPAAWLVSRRLTETAGPWDQRLSRSGDDDGEYICRVVLASEQVMFVPAAKCYYRVGHPGTLSRRRADDAYEALLLATALSINHLLSAADNQDTRAACIRLLENRLWHFYPEKFALAAELQRLAVALGSNRLQLRETWKYLLAARLCGPAGAKKLREIVSRTRLLPARTVDRFFYVIYRERDRSFLPDPRLENV